VPCEPLTTATRLAGGTTALSLMAVGGLLSLPLLPDEAPDDLWGVRWGAVSFSHCFKGTVWGLAAFTGYAAFLSLTPLDAWVYGSRWFWPYLAVGLGAGRQPYLGSERRPCCPHVWAATGWCPVTCRQTGRSIPRW
jgi:hypothetical protein